MHESCATHALESLVQTALAVTVRDKALKGITEHFNYNINVMYSLLRTVHLNFI